MFIATAILSILLAVMFIGAGATKVAGTETHRAGAARAGFPYPAWRGIGGLEIAAAAGLLLGLAVAPLGVAAAVGLVLLMIGAAIVHARVHDPAAKVAAPLVFGAVAAATAVLRLATA